MNSFQRIQSKQTETLRSKRRRFCWFVARLTYKNKSLCLPAPQLQHISSVYSASVPEVLLELMTSETRLERVDLLMDLGTQLNGAVRFGPMRLGDDVRVPCY